jgi:hypothetical protein
MNEYKYHIYLKNNCIYHSLSEEDFNNIWSMIGNFVSITGTVNKEDLSYEKVIFSKELSYNSSH